MITCDLCDHEPRGPFYVHRSPVRETVICGSCFDEFRQYALDSVRSATATAEAVRSR